MTMARRAVERRRRVLRPVVVVVGEKERKMNLRHVSRVLTHTLRSRAALSVFSDLSDFRLLDSWPRNFLLQLFSDFIFHHPSI